MTSVTVPRVARLWSVSVIVACASVAPCDASSASQDLADGATAVPARVTLDPQTVVWTDPLWSYSIAAAYDTLHDEFIVAWTTDQDLFSSDIWARRVASSGALLDGFNVARVPGDILEGPATAYCQQHDEYLISYTDWYEADGDRADVQARRVARSGAG